MNYISAALPTNPKKRQIVIGAGAVLAVVLVLAIVKYFQISAAIKEHMSFSPPPEAVTSIVAAEVNWGRTIEAVGSLVPEKGVTVSAEQPGKVVNIAFESGAYVKEGDLLVEIDPSVEQANLQSALARQEWTQRSLSRAQRLRGSNAVSQEVLDDAIAQHRQATAEVESLRAVIAKKRITAPFAGRLGIRKVNIGQFVKEGDPIVPLHSLDPLFADFSVPQQSVGSVAAGHKVEIKVDAYPGTIFSGAVAAVNPQVDGSTRNLGVRATIPNPEEKLHPGMFAEVKVLIPQEDKVIPLPATAIQYAPYGDTVYVIEKMNGPKGEYVGVRQQVVQLGRKVGDQVAILSGIKPGEEIVTSGLFKLHQGAGVLVNNTFSPHNELAPKPADT